MFKDYSSYSVKSALQGIKNGIIEFNWEPNILIQVRDDNDMELGGTNIGDTSKCTGDIF